MIERNKQEERKILFSIFNLCFTSRILDVSLQELFNKGLVTRVVFSGVGTEVYPTIIANIMSKTDYLIPRYRGYAPLLAKGLSPYRIACEILRKSSGPAKGIGDVGSLHDIDLRIVGQSGVLGSMFGVALGIAYSLILRKEPNIVVHFFGDGEASRSSFGSALNLAALWKLPILFVCENNKYSMFTDGSHMSATPRIADRASGYGVEAETFTNPEPMYFYNRVLKIVNSIRNSRRPFLLEIIQPKFAPHSSLEGTVGNTLNPYLQSDPLDSLEQKLIQLGVTLEELEERKQSITRSIQLTIIKALSGKALNPKEFLALYGEK